MLPSIFGENLFDDLFGFSGFPEFRDIDRRLYGRHAAREMKTDVHELDDRYEVDIDLPGFKKDEITLGLDNGFLTISAAKGLDEDKTDKEGRVIRQERCAGAMQRSFFVGRNVTADEVSAKFENGVLSLTIPKKDQPKMPDHRTIAIEG